MNNLQPKRIISICSPFKTLNSLDQYAIKKASLWKKSMDADYFVNHQYEYHR